MKPSDFQKAVQCRFESCLKRTIRHVVKDYQQELKRRKNKEIPFCELPDIIVEKLSVWDEYETDYTIFNVSLRRIRQRLYCCRYGTERTYQRNII